MKTYPAVRQWGTPEAIGVLMLVGDFMPQDIPVWVCPHRHPEVASSFGLR